MSKLYYFFCICMVFLFSTPVQSQEKVYIIGVEDLSYYPLYNFSADNTSRSSFTRDLLAEFFESHHLDYRFVALPIKRFDKWFVEENIDFKFPDSPMWRKHNKNNLNFSFSEPVLELVVGTYVHKRNKDITQQEVSNLMTILGFTSVLWKDEVERNQVSITEETTPLNIVKHVLQGNVDATNIDSNVISSHLKIQGREGDIVLAKNIKHGKYHYHFSSLKHPEIIALFNKFLAENKKFLIELKRKYHITG